MNTALQGFDPITAAWFESSVGTPTPAQAEGWPKIAAGGHVLISAPTGTGKTLSAFLVFIDRLKAEARRGALPNTLQLIYISPLKALGNDIRENLRRPLDGIDGPELSVAIRTGDTPQAERRRMALHPPHILITTPESLYLLLTSQSGKQVLKTARAVIVDELHALIGGKRGAHLMLSLARLDALCGKPLQRIGLSATIEPLETAAAYLAAPDPVAVIAPRMQKSIALDVISPLKDMRVLPEGTIWPELARSVYEHCEGMRTVIAFVEGRAQAEKLAHGVNLLGGEGFARTHHGSVSKEKRLDAEEALRSGKLRLLCATSSMELGIDVGEVDLVLQIGFPRTISSCMQRLGRAGHNPGRTSVMRMFPRTAAEGVYCGLTADTALAGAIEQARPPVKCLDVLAQHLVSMATTDGYTVDEAMRILRRAWPFAPVTEDELCTVLRMLAGDFEHAIDRPARPRLLYDRIHGTVIGDKYSRMLALSAAGTIPDRGLYAAKLADGTRLGELDEEFVFEARVGDKFLLGSFAWRIQEIQRDSVIVTPASTDGAQSPFWRGDGIGRPLETGLAFGRKLRALTEANAIGGLHKALCALRLDDAAAENAADFIHRQIEATGCLPDDRTILVEHFRDQAGEHQMMVHSVFGGQVNAGLALLVRDAVRRKARLETVSYDDDDGFLVQPFGGDRPLPERILYDIPPETAQQRLAAVLPGTPLFGMAFRYNAGRALMMGVRSGRRLPLWVQRLRGAQALDGAVTQPDHPLIQETRRECLSTYWDLPGIERILTGIRSGEIAVREMRRQEPSPMALPLRRQVEATMMYDYFPTTANVMRAVDSAVSMDSLGPETMIAPAPEQLDKVSARTRQPADMEQLHALLLAEGDLIVGEVEAPLEWLEGLAARDRAAYIEPGLWIAAEQTDAYRAALVDGDADARRRMARRCLRYRGAHSALSLADRYFLPEGDCRALLETLVDDRVAVREGDLYYHAELYGRAQRETVMMRRRQAETLPPARYAALTAGRTRLMASPAEQLHSGIAGLLDQPFPPALWESVLLPARVMGYRPAMLDALLAEGEFFWRMTDEERPLLSFHRSEDIDWNGDFLAVAGDDALNDDERALTRALAARGASFMQGLTNVLPGQSPLEALLALMARGLVRADSFAPVREWLGRSKSSDAVPERRARARAAASTAGRWELLRPLVARDAETLLHRAFDRAALLCRETVQGLGPMAIPWAQALATLRVWEYTGKARRGYFIRGLSGAQFLRDTEAQAVALQMQSPRDEILWLNAADPAQPWGRALAHEPDRAFLCVPGTAVALRQGTPVALLERQGLALRLFDADCAGEALAALARDFAQGRVFPAKNRITVKEYPEEAVRAMEEAGFVRQMLAYELWRRRG